MGAFIALEGFRDDPEVADDALEPTPPEGSESGLATEKEGEDDARCGENPRESYHASARLGRNRVPIKRQAVRGPARTAWCVAHRRSVGNRPGVRDLDDGPLLVLTSYYRPNVRFQTGPAEMEIR